MAKLSLLFIAPYPELAVVAERVAREYRDIRLTVHTGDLDEGVRQALVDYHTHFDAVISRGGTAETLEDELSIPVVKMEPSVRELLDNLAAANPTGGRMAAVGFKAVFAGFEPLRQLLPYELDIFTADFDDQIPELLDEIEAVGYDTVLCDTVSFAQASARGIPCHLLESSEEGVRTAIDQAASTCRTIERERSMNLLLWHVIGSLEADFAIYDDTGQLAFSSIPGGAEGHGVLDYIAQHRDAAESDGRLLLRRAGHVFDIRARSLVISGKRHAIFSIKRRKIPTGHTGIDLMNADEVRKEYDRSVFATVGAALNLAPVVRRAVASRSPLLLEGEVGSGKDQIARLIYLEGRYAQRPFAQVSCDLLNDRAWRHFIKSHESPLFRSDITIYMRGLHALSSERWHELLAVIRDSALTGRSRLIMSCSDDAQGRACEAAVRFAEQLRCTVLIAPSLRSAADVPDRLQRYLDRLAREEGLPAPTMEPGAREVAASASWPGNYLQLREVAERLHAVHGHKPISERLVREALERDQSAAAFESRRDAAETPTGTGAGHIDALRPLAETERLLARTAVEQCDGNRTRAAQALGISRTTLWRLLS